MCEWGVYFVYTTKRIDVGSVSWGAGFILILIRWVSTFSFVMVFVEEWEWV